MTKKAEVKKKVAPTQVDTETFNAVLDTLQHMRDDEPAFNADPNLQMEQHVQKLRDDANALIQKLDPENEVVAPVETPNV